jgi:hypothetical protein
MILRCTDCLIGHKDWIQVVWTQHTCDGPKTHALDTSHMHWTHQTKQANQPQYVRPKQYFFVDGTSRPYFMNARSVLRVTAFGNYPRPTSGKAVQLPRCNAPQKSTCVGLS